MLDIELIRHLLEYFEIPILNTTLYAILAYVIPRTFRFIIFWVMYQWIPKASVKPYQAFWGATFTLILTELITIVMSWYTSSQWMRYELIYGSLGRIIALLLWIYFSSYVIFFGAHISSALSQAAKMKKKTESEAE